MGRVTAPAKGRFYFCGTIGNMSCIFKIDTGSDVSLVREALIDFSRESYSTESRALRYPMGEKVLMC